MNPDIEPMLTIAPEPWFSICRPKARQHQNRPSTLTSIWKRQCSSLVSSALTSLLATPALLTRMSTRPCSAMSLAATASTSFDFVTSSFAPCASILCLRNSATRASIRSGTISATITLAPASPSASAQAAPMPWPAPVTTATLPLSRSFSKYMMILSTHPVSAVDIERLGDDIVALGRCQEYRSTDMVFRRAHAAEGYGFADQAFLLAERPPLIFGEERIDLVPHWRVDHPRRYAVYIDAVLDEREARRLGYADDGRFRCAIDGDQRLAAAAGLRCHIDDLAASLGGDHLAGDGLEGEQQSFHVDGKDAVVAFLGDFLDRGHLEYGGIVDENIDRASLAQHAVDRGKARDIEPDREGIMADHGGGCPGRLAVNVGDTNARALGSEAAGDRLADPACPAGDNREPSRKSHVASAFPL